MTGQGLPLLLFCGLLFALASGGCRSPASLEGNWGIPPQEGDGVTRSREVVLVADNQIQHLYGEPVWLRSGFTNRFVSVAIRAVQLDFFGPDMLRWIIENYADKRLVIHLGDALNVACSAEWETFLRTVGAAQHGWVLAPGNHDAFYFGNGDFSQGEWARACNTADGRGYPFVKDRFVEAYLAALSRQKAEGISGFAFSIAEPIPEKGLWEAPAGQNSVVTGVAWRIDRERPWRSYVAQRLDLRLPGRSEPVSAILVDTSQYALRPGLLPIYPWRNSGITGSMGSDQVEAVTGWLEKEPARGVKMVMGHHPYDVLTGSSRRALDRWRARLGVDLYVSAHTHTAQYFVHREGETSWVELNVGSTTDWPPEFRTIAVSTDARYADRIALRLQRYPLHEIWEERQIPDCDPAWEVPPEREDFYIAYDELVSEAEETQKALLDTLLRSHAWILRFVGSGKGNTVWPEGTTDDAAVDAAIKAALSSKRLGDKLRLLRQLEVFERDRTVANPGLRDDFHLCQAQWASKYDLKGRRAPNVDDAYIVLPAE